MSRASLLAGVLLAGVPLAAPGCRQAGRDVAGGEADSAFAAVQARGAGVMGVDQYTSRHVFEDLPWGGRIVLERDDASDQPAIEAIRRHMREVAADFATGDFRRPLQVHAREVPGSAVMAERRAALTYTVSDRPRGAEMRIATADSVALTAVHAFLAFQRADHRAAGHEGHSGH